jgi:hypothetical protein
MWMLWMLFAIAMTFGVFMVVQESYTLETKRSDNNNVYMKKLTTVGDLLEVVEVQPTMIWSVGLRFSVIPKDLNLPVEELSIVANNLLKRKDLAVDSVLYFVSSTDRSCTVSLDRPSGVMGVVSLDGVTAVGDTTIYADMIIVFPDAASRKITGGQFLIVLFRTIDV